MSAFWGDIKQELRSRIVIAFWATISLFMVVTGPYGTYLTYTMLERMAICVPIMATFLVIGVVIRVGVHRFFGRDGWKEVLLSSGIDVVVLAPFTTLVLHLVAPSAAVSFPSMTELGLLVASLSLGYSALRRSVSQEDSADPELVRQSRLMQRIAPDGLGDLLAISVQDHYVEVHTSTGSSRVLLRLGDAIAEAEPIDGAQVHRSHWVAWQAVVDVEQDGIKLFVHLINGMRVPVSKNHRGKLAERGLI